MRHKILAAMEDSETKNPTRLSAVKECDETFVLESLKGTEIPAGYWRGAVAISVNRAKPDESELRAAFNGYLDENTLVLCDGLRSYGILNTAYGCSVKDVNLETNKYFHLNNANGFHSFIKKHYAHFGGDCNEISQPV